jgi:hypothetical protein
VRQKQDPVAALLWVRELNGHHLVEQNCPAKGGPELAAKRKTEVKESRNWWSTAQLPIERTCRKRHERRGRVARGTARTAGRGRDSFRALYARTLLQQAASQHAACAQVKQPGAAALPALTGQRAPMAVSGNSTAARLYMFVLNMGASQQCEG